VADRYRIDIAPAAKRQLASLSTEAQRRIRAAIDRLELDSRPRGVLRLAGTSLEPRWRLRVGDYRVVYEIHDDELLVLVIRIGHRREVYRLR
jgi:mRNA interferase RelE/StbE